MSINDKKTPLASNTIEWISLIASMVSIIGIVFLFFQQKTAEESVRINSLGQIYTQMLDIDKMFAQNPELRLYIYYNKTPEDVFSELLNSREPSKQRSPSGNDVSPTSVKYTYEKMKIEASAAAAGELMLDFFSMVILELPKLGEAGEPWKRYMKDVYKCSPVVRKLYEEKFAWYDMELPEIFRVVVASTVKS
jgi:hypothetical protein